MPPQDFLFGRLIGEGSFSTVFLAREIASRRDFAIKVCDKRHILKEKKQDYIASEKKILVKIASEWDDRVPFFVKIYSTFQVCMRLVSQNHSFFVFTDTITHVVLYCRMPPDCTLS